MAKSFVTPLLALIGAMIAYQALTLDLLGAVRTKLAAPTAFSEHYIPRKCLPAAKLVTHLQEELFQKESCSNLGRTMLRLAYHDAMGFSINGGKGGGADGSILVFPEEREYSVNSWTDLPTQELLKSTSNFVGNISAGDLLFLAAAVGISTCQGAPRVKIFLGRPGPTGPAVDGTVSVTTGFLSAIKIHQRRFSPVSTGFSPSDLVALMSAHSIATLYLDPLGPFQRGAPFDSTSGAFDTQYFLETMLQPETSAETPPGIMLSAMEGEPRLQSDWALSQDLRTSCAWSSMINNHLAMQKKFRAAFEKLSLIGQDHTKLTDCSGLLDLLPPAASVAAAVKYPPGFSAADFVGKCPSPVLETTPGPKEPVPPVPCKNCSLGWHTQLSTELP